MKILAESELMRNQKQGNVLGPDATFDAIQTVEGTSVYFSIGTDNIFYATREEIGTSLTGWTKLPLSSTLPAQYATAQKKSFCVAQNTDDMSFNVMLVVHDGQNDMLFVSLENENTVSAWSKGLQWTPFSFDAKYIHPPSPLVICKCTAMVLQNAGTNPVKNMFVDILRQPSAGTNLIDRYYLNLANAPHWNQRNPNIDLQAGTTQDCLGNQPSSGSIPGIYTMGSLAGQRELVYTPQHVRFGNVAPESIRIPFPPNATLDAIDSAEVLSGQYAGCTALFGACKLGLYYYAPGQTSQSTPLQIFDASKAVEPGMFNNISRISATIVNNTNVVWCHNKQGLLFYLSCPVGQEAQPASWTVPLPLSYSVSNYAFYLNNSTSTNQLFLSEVNSSSETVLTEVFQHPERGWVPRSVLLPPDSVNDVHDRNTWSTQIKVVSDTGHYASSEQISIKSSRTAKVFINNMAYNLSPTAATTVKTDINGGINIVESTTSLAALSYTVQCGTDPPVPVQPIAAANQTMQGMTGPKLQSLQVPDGKGGTRPFLPTGITGDDVTNTVGGMHQLLALKVNSTTTSTIHTHLRTTKSSLEHKDLPQMKLGWFGDVFECVASDFYHFIKHVATKVTQFAVKTIKGAWHFMVQLTTGVFHAVVKTVEDVAHAIQFVFNKIKIGFEDLIAWLGFLFDWDDILRTHSVLESLILNFTKHCVDDIKHLKGKIDSFSAEAQQFVDNFTGITVQSSETFSSQSTQAQSTPKINSPQSHWGTAHVHHHISDAHSYYDDTGSMTSTIEQVLSQLYSAGSAELDDFKEAATSAQALWKNRSNLSVSDILMQIFGIITKIGLQSATNLVNIFIDLAVDVVQGTVDMLTKKLDIPIISWIYNVITEGKEELSILRLLCLVCAVPATVISKAVTGSVPFPDNPQTDAIIDACMVVSQLKVCVDNSPFLNDPEAGPWVGKYNDYISPWVDSALNTVWFISLLGSLKTLETWSDSDKPMWLANAAFDLGGILAPGASIKMGEESAPIFFGLMMLANQAYAAGAMVSGGIILLG